jgi:hypothetical protein
MTDQGPGSPSDQPADREGAPGADLDAPNPFSRESSSSGASSAEPDDGSGTSAHGSGQGAAADPFAYPPSPGTGTAPPPRSGSATAGPGDPGGEDGSTRAYGQNQYPSAQPEPDPSQPYGHPRTQPSVPPGGHTYPEPAQPYSQPPVDPYGQPGVQGPGEPVAGYDPQGGYGQPYGAAGPGSAYEVSPYQGAYGGYSAYGVPPVQHPQVVAALVTGLLGVLTCPFVGVAGIVLGAKARREIDADPQRYTGRGMATAGLVLGIIGTILTVLLVLGAIALVSIAAPSP